MSTVRSLSLATLALVLAAPLAAQTDGCALLDSTDVKPLLGKEKPSKTMGPGVGCVWGGAGSGGPNNHSVVIRTPHETAEQAKSDFSSGEQNALKHPDKAKVEAGLGDKAYSQLASYGVSVVILKGDRLLQLQFATGKPGTPDQLALLLVMAKKAAAAF